jgi:hypothetical protein
MYRARSKHLNDEMYMTYKIQWNNECTKIWATHEKGQEMHRKPEIDSREKKNMKRVVRSDMWLRTGSSGGK